MKRGSFGTIFFLAVLLLNIILGIATLTEYDRLYSSSNAEIDAVLQQYEKRAVAVDCVINRQSRPQPALVFVHNDDALSDFSQSIAKRATVQHDDDRHVLSARSRQFDLQKAWLSAFSDSQTSWVKTNSISYVQKQGSDYYFFNTAHLSRQKLNVTYRTVRVTRDRIPIRPIDEMLYQALVNAPAAATHLREIRYGYDATDEEIIYCLEFVFDTGTVRINAADNTVVSLSEIV